MKILIAFLFVFGMSSFPFQTFAGSCGGGDHIHTEEEKIDKKLGA